MSIYKRSFLSLRKLVGNRKMTSQINYNVILFKLQLFRLFQYLIMFL